METRQNQSKPGCLIQTLLKFHQSKESKKRPVQSGTTLKLKKVCMTGCTRKQSKRIKLLKRNNKKKSVKWIAYVLSNQTSINIRTYYKNLELKFIIRRLSRVIKRQLQKINQEQFKEVHADRKNLSKLNHPKKQKFT